VVTHELAIIDPSEYDTRIRALVLDTVRSYERVCYVSFNETYEIAIEFLERAPILPTAYTVIIANRHVTQTRALNDRTIIMRLTDLFNVYLYLRSIITERGIRHLIIDNLSALIAHNNELPLKEMITDLLLDIGRLQCAATIIAFTQDRDHEVVTNLEPFISRTTQR